jgi:hypothetical protein
MLYEFEHLQLKSLDLYKDLDLATIDECSTISTAARSAR